VKGDRRVMPVQPDRRRQLLDELARTPGDSLADRICHLCVAGDIDGAAILLHSGDHLLGTAARDGALGALIADLELTLGEGPGHQAVQSGTTVFADQLLTGTSQSWPIFATHAQQAGIAAVFAYPLQLGSIMLGVLEVARGRAGSLSPPELIDTAHLASLATSALLLSQSHLNDQDVLDLLELSEPTQLRIHQATGMAAEQTGASLPDALALLRAHALVHEQSLSEVAQLIITRKIRMDP